MRTTAVIKARLTSDLKARIVEHLARELLTESIWLRRLIVQELRRAGATPGTRERPVTNQPCEPERPTARLSLRLPREDRQRLVDRAAARGMASATYVTHLVRSHLRSHAPLPKLELTALKRAVAELGAIGRNLNQLARAANTGAPGSARIDEFKAILKVCEALRDHTKQLIKINQSSWQAGHATD
jgi:hypothetical protein